MESLVPEVKSYLGFVCEVSESSLASTEASATLKSPKTFNIYCIVTLVPYTQKNSCIPVFPVFLRNHQPVLDLVQL